MKHGKFVMTILVNDSKVVQGSKKFVYNVWICGKFHTHLYDVACDVNNKITIDIYQVLIFISK
jgi:hypothetical protein